MVISAFDHNHTHTYPLDEESARRRDLYLTTHNTHKDKFPYPGGIRTRNVSKRTAADLRLRPRRHWARIWTWTNWPIFTKLCITYFSFEAILTF
jgi:hypothetical protein